MEVPRQHFSEEQLSDVHYWEQLYNLCNNPLPDGQDVGSIIIPTGDWMERVYPAVDFFRERSSSQAEPPHLVITGQDFSDYHLHKKGSAAVKVARLIKIYGGLTDKMNRMVIADGDAINAWEQAVNVTDLLISGKIKGPFVLFVSAYHLPRNYMSFIKALISAEHNPQTKLYSVPVIMDWEGRSRDMIKDGARWKEVIKEVGKIREYQDKGHVTTEEELERYVAWLKNGESL